MEIALMPQRSKAVIENAKKERKRQARIHLQTRGAMRIRTENMFAHASRDYQRQQHVPTKRTRPALHKRRYSVDVNTGFEKHGTRKTCDCNLLQLESVAHQTRKPNSDDEVEQQALELVAPSTPPLPFPTPHRYHGFNKFYHYTAPIDDARYLRLGDSNLTNKEFHNIACSSGYDSFMEDNSLDSALAALSLAQQCDTSSIRIASTVEAQICFNPDPTGKEEYGRIFSDKRWIFIPVNDALGEWRNAGLRGQHWTLVALDRVHRYMHYFDSLFMGRQDFWATACAVALGMLRIVGEDQEEWTFCAEFNSPNQYRDNLCMHDEGACGPFVWTMVSLFVDEIQRLQRAGREEECCLGLADHVPEWFGSWWDSARARQRMQDGIAVVRKWQDVEAWAMWHDQKAVEGEEVEFMDEPPLRFTIPPWGLRSAAQTSHSNVETEFADTAAASDKPGVTVRIQLPSENAVHSLERAASSNEHVLRTWRDDDEEEAIPSIPFNTDDDVKASAKGTQEVRDLWD